MSKTKKITLSALLCAVSVLFGYVEYLIPVNIGIPGVKLGIANIMVVFVLYYLGIPEGIAVNLLRILISAALFSSFSAFLYSLCGAVLSFAVMSLLMKAGADLVLASAAGGMAHNIGQMIAAVLVLGTPRILVYLLVLIPVGIFTGALIGLLSKEVLHRLIRIHRPD